MAAGKATEDKESMKFGRFFNRDFRPDALLIQQRIAIRADRKRVKRLHDMVFGPGRDVRWKGNELWVLAWVKERMDKSICLIDNLPATKKLNVCLSAVAHRIYELTQKKTGYHMPDEKELKELEMHVMQGYYSPLSKTDPLLIAYLNSLQESRMDRATQRITVFEIGRQNIETLELNNTATLTSQFAFAICDMEDYLRETTSDKTINWWMTG
ncbi:MAG: hypothetical protein Hyperionvirus3_18 [Hyperionvirus sp.]|uniref:Uncharacterized protein n=1 Tax=Hyperionvirus sp. TaxID=2487770 RepID=A0A3G5A758_9VIRU|nr:MAG: hypothetical protein Hyperionvirus3_18 [Hyperionvirus sp.]